MTIEFARFSFPLAAGIAVFAMGQANATLSNGVDALPNTEASAIALNAGINASSMDLAFQRSRLFYLSQFLWEILVQPLQGQCHFR